MIIDLIFVGTDEINKEDFVNEELFSKKYCIFDNDGFLGIGDGYIDSFENFLKLFQFLFNEEFNSELLFSYLEKKIYDLNDVKHKCITIEDLEAKFNDWIEISQREHSMDEYGNLIGIISYIQRTRNKKNLILIIEKRNH